MECSICSPHDPVEEPPRWLPLARLCPAHAAQARLPNGVLLEELVRAAPMELEGSALGFVLNPLRVGERRCWSSWAAGGYAVFSERHRSANYFEFEALHRPELVGLLHQFSQRSWSRPVATRPALELLVELGDRSRRRLEQLCLLRRQALRYDGALRERGPVRSAAEALAIFREVGLVEIEPTRLGSDVDALLDLAARRFARA